MTSNEPPRLATWLLKRFGGHPNNEAIIGDLIERFRGGETVGWYWVQVFKAIAVNGGKLAGFGIGLVTAGSSIVWNVTFNPRTAMGHFNLFSLGGAWLTILCAVVYWSRQLDGVARVTYRLWSAAWVAALTLSTSMFAFSWWWFPSHVTQSAGARQSITKFAIIDFVLMLVIVLAIGSLSSIAAHVARLRRSRDGSN